MTLTPHILLRGEAGRLVGDTEQDREQDKSVNTHLVRSRGGAAAVYLPIEQRRDHHAPS